MRISKATSKEISTYDSHRRLYGFVYVSDVKCSIEHLDDNDSYRYEVLAPEGYRFDDNVTGLLVTSIADLKETFEGVECVECTPEI